MVFLLFLLCAHNVLSASVWEHSGLSPRPHVVLLSLCLAMLPVLLQSFRVQLQRAWVLDEGWNPGASGVIHSMMLWLQVLRWV